MKKKFLFLADDQSRVILDKEEGDPDSDYINANYIDVSAHLVVNLNTTVLGNFQEWSHCSSVQKS